jgi:hypothetical protein
VGAAHEPAFVPPSGTTARQARLRSLRGLRATQVLRFLVSREGSEGGEGARSKLSDVHGLGSRPILEVFLAPRSRNPSQPGFRISAVGFGTVPIATAERLA